VISRGVKISAAASAIHRATTVACLNPDARGTGTDTGRNTHSRSADAYAGRNTYSRGADTRGRNRDWPCHTAFRYACGLAINHRRARRRRSNTAFRYAHGLAINHRACRWCCKCQAQRYDCNQTNHHNLQIDIAR